MSRDYTTTCRASEVVGSASDEADTNENEDNIRVLIRIRPPLQHEVSSTYRGCLKIGQDSKSLCIGPKTSQEKSFTYDAIFDENTPQDEVFNVAGKVVADNAIKGYNGSIFAYGQTGSGKTVGWTNSKA